MLSQKISNGEIVTIKLLSGEEIIGKYESEDNSYLYVTKPRIFVIMQSPDGKPNIGLAALAHSANIDASPIPIHKNSIIFFCKSDQNIANEFSTNVLGSLIKPTSGLIKP